MEAVPPASVEEYLARLPETSRTALEQVRAALRSVLPQAQESISYQMPTLRIGGEVVLHYAGWSRHFSLYPASEAIRAEVAADPAPHEVRGSTLRFPLSAPVPTGLIERIAAARAREVTGAHP